MIDTTSHFKAIILGVVQGLTEFLPVSSSAHLVILQSLFGLTNPEEMLALDIALHLGTLLSVMVALRREILVMRIRDWVLVGVATIPAVIVGLGFKDQVEKLFVAPRVAAVGLLVTGLVLWLTRWPVSLSPSRSSGQGSPEASLSIRTVVTFGAAFLIGLAQAIAIMPRISRSGSTIAAGLFLGLPQVAAARFSFLMAIPAILGSAVLEIPKVPTLSANMISAMVVGTAASAVVGFAAIWWLLKIISREKLHLFSYYCWAVGLLALFTL